MREVVWSQTAIRQYAAAIEYLAERNEPAAARLAVRVWEALDILRKRPIGRPGQSAGTFEKIVQGTSYLVVFETSGDEIRLMRLFHMAQDWQSWQRTTDEEI